MIGRRFTTHIYRCALLIIFAFACTPTRGQISDHSAPKHASETWITIFVHGIMSIAPHINFRNFTLFMCDDIVDTVYARTVNIMRQDPFFHNNQAMNGFGIQQLNPNKIKKGNAPNAIARIYDEVNHIVNPEQKYNYYYTYGWSGLLSVTQRYQEAEGLLIAIHQLVKKFEVIGVKPKVRLIGYSHGGNVCLNTAAIHRDKYPDMPITIDELILIGMPVQVETDYLIESPIFKEVYHIYSTVDRIQCIDFFSFNRVFSDRIFKSRRNFKLPDKLTQINVKITRMRTITNDKQRRRINALDFTKPSNLSGQRHLWRDISPGHIELWFFGWSGKYRDHFPLNPLPVLTAVPFIIAEIKHYKDRIKPYPVIFDIRPDFEIALIKQRKHNKLQEIRPFLSIATLNDLRDIAEKVRPEGFSKATYQEHIMQALNEAQKQYDEQKAVSRCTRPARKKRRRFRGKPGVCSPVDRCYRVNAEGCK